MRSGFAVVMSALALAAAAAHAAPAPHVVI